MKKKWNVFWMAALIALSSFYPQPSAHAASEIKVTVNGEVLETPVPPVMVDNSVLVPMRSIFEALGAKLEWNQQEQKVTSTKDAVVIVLTIGSNTAEKNGEKVKLAAAPQSVNGSTLVPLRFVADALGSSVEWVPATQTVAIVQSKEEAPSPSDETAMREVVESFYTFFNARDSERLAALYDPPRETVEQLNQYFSSLTNGVEQTLETVEEIKINGIGGGRLLVTQITTVYHFDESGIQSVAAKMRNKTQIEVVKIKGEWKLRKFTSFSGEQIPH